MLNKDIFVPENTIAVFRGSNRHKNKDVSKEQINNILMPSPKKREWFTSHFYKCLPLSIGNQYGFVLSLEFDVAILWNGGNSTEDIFFEFAKEQEELSEFIPRIDSHFGHGIVTVSTPFSLRTPPGVNIMTINPPNFIVPNITAMTGVVETDNLRRDFTFNLKIQMPNIKTIIPAGTPIAGFIPVPRYYCDNFELVFADDIFEKNVINEESEIIDQFYKHREELDLNSSSKTDGFYFRGEDIYGNKFEDHQIKSGKK